MLPSQGTACLQFDDNVHMALVVKYSSILKKTNAW